MVAAIKRELEMRKSEFQKEQVQTIYFGGGTPSLLETEEIMSVIDQVYRHYKVLENPEITLEANPDDLSEEKLQQLAVTKINRLSIGIQSFFDEDLKLMNRAHDAREAKNCLKVASDYFENISIDLIYGIPGMDHKRWQQNIAKALSFNVPHISSYALTVEPNTALKVFIDKGLITAPDDEVVEEQFRDLVEILERKGYINYELSNFGKPAYFSRNNTAYWQGKKYMGIGPSAHSYDGQSRGWNIRNNVKYLKSISEGKLNMEYEVLSKKDKYNEYIMTGLRTMWGVSLDRVASDFGNEYRQYLLRQAEKHLKEQLLFVEKEMVYVSKKGKFLTDGIASDLFMVKLK